MPSRHHALLITFASSPAATDLDAIAHMVNGSCRWDVHQVFLDDKNSAVGQKQLNSALSSFPVILKRLCTSSRAAVGETLTFFPFASDKTRGTL